MTPPAPRPASAPRVGVDVLDREELLGLIERPWFLRFTYAPQELAHAERMSGERRTEFLTGRFAAKEAVLKVMGRGLFQGIAPREVCVDRTPEGLPEVRLLGRAAAAGPSAISVSITHKRNVVAAVAIGVPAPPPTAEERSTRERSTDQEGKDSARVTAP